MRPFGSGSRGARGHTGRLRRLPGNTTPAASLQGVPLLLSASRLVAWCLPLGVHPPVAPPLARACSRWVRPQGVFSAGVRCRSVLLPRRSAFSGRGPDTLLGFSTSADTPCSLATVLPRWHPLVALAPPALRAAASRLLPSPLGLLTFSVSPLQASHPVASQPRLSAPSPLGLMGVTRRGVSGRPISGASRPPEADLGLDHVPLLRPPLSRLPVTRQRFCSLQGLPLQLRAAGSSPAAPSMTFHPSSRSSSAGVRCHTEVQPVPLLGVRPASVAPSPWVVRASQHGSARGLFSLESPRLPALALRPGLQRLPPGKMSSLLS